MIDLLKQYTIKAKIKIIAFSAISIIVSMLFSLILFSDYFNQQEATFYKNQIKIEIISKELKEKLLKRDTHLESQEDINKYFDQLKELSQPNLFLKKGSTAQSFLDTFILLLMILLLLFIFFGYLLNQTITQSLGSLKQGMKKFFNYVIHNEQQIDKIDVIYQDEVGAILNYINEHLYEVKKIIEHEREFNLQLEKNISAKTELLMEKSNYLEQYKYMIDEAEAVIQFDMFGNIIDVNDHYCTLSKYTRKELLGQPIVDFISSSDSDNDFAKEITHVIKDGGVYKGINSDIAKDGNTFTTKTVILPMVNKEGIIESFFCIRTDISELKALTDDIIATQKDVISTMGEIGESRSKETGLHVKRVAEYSRLLAQKYGLDKEQCELIYNASPMHDIGKVGIPDYILNKPGKLTSEEYEIMKTHAKLGYEMLKHSKRNILSAAAIVSHEHHERYNGTGYPNNKKGEEIHIFGRITAVADIFDALGSDRCYKKAWKLEDITELLLKEKGEHFDPILIDLFLENIDEFIEIRDRLKDNVEFEI